MNTTTQTSALPSTSAATGEHPPNTSLTWADRSTMPRNLRDMLCLEDFEPAAKRILPRPIYGYVSGGVEGNVSLRGNRSAFDDIAFVPRILVNTGTRTLKTTLLGQTYDAPFGFAPMGGTSMAAYQGDAVLARCAAEENIPMILSGASLMTLEKVKQVGRTAWFQAYLPGDDQVITELVERAQRGGYDTLALTVDVPVTANRENNVRNGFNTPLRPNPRLAWDCMIRPRWLFGMFVRTLLKHGMPHVENMGPRVPLISGSAVRGKGRRDLMSWRHLELIRKIWKGKLLIKGVLDPRDVRIARESGADGVMVSNHGGRQLDSTVAPLRMLPAIAAEAKGMAVIMDSGIRRGTDIIKALTLGANFVFIGRPFLYAAAVAGAPGVHHAVKLLREEIDRDMAMLGITSLKDIPRDILTPAHGADFLKSIG